MAHFDRARGAGISPPDGTRGAGILGSITLMHCGFGVKTGEQAGIAHV